MKPKLSAFIIAYNAERKFEACLKSLTWADEIVVVDSDSKDKTPELAKAYGAKFHSKPFTDFASQKNFALNLCSGDWLLSVDSDEVITDALRDEILATINDPRHDAYRIRRHSIIFGKEFRFSGTQDDKPVRLIKRGKGQFVQPIHEFIEVYGSTGELENHMLHFTYNDTAEYFERFERYTNSEARYLAQKNYKMSPIDFLLRPPAMFVKLYLLKKGFLDGWQGFRFCLYSAWYVFVKYSKYGKSLKK